MIWVPIVVIVTVPKKKHKFKIVNDYSEETILLGKQSDKNLFEMLLILRLCSTIFYHYVSDPI